MTPPYHIKWLLAIGMCASIKVVYTDIPIPVGSAAIMSSIKALLCDLCVMLVLGLSVAEVVAPGETPLRY